MWIKCLNMASSSSGVGAAPDDVRLRGGRQQRKRKLQEVEAQHDVRSDNEVVTRKFEFDAALAAELIERWCWGFCSAVDVQKLSHKSFLDMRAVLQKTGMSDDHIPSSLKALASLGTWGRHPGNVNKELKSLLGEPSYPPPRSFPLRVKVSKPRASQKNDQANRCRYP